MIIDYSTLQKIRAENSDSMIALIKGTFDLLHYDHIKLLQTIKSQNDIVVVQVKSDVDAREKGAGRPIMCETERSAIVDSIRYTDYTIVACEQGNTELIERLSSQSTYSEREIYKLKRDGYVLELLRPNRNYYTTEKRVHKSIKDICDMLGISTEIVPVQGNIHTTDIVKRIQGIVLS